MRSAARWALLLLAAACADREPLQDVAPSPRRADGELALPPSASMPRASLPPGFTPDTVRPAGVTAPDTLFEEFGGVVPGVGDLGSIVDAYRLYYHDEHERAGSAVEGRIDPRLSDNAKRRAANDWGFAGSSGWARLVDQLPDGARVDLAERIHAIDRALVDELHGS